MMPNDSQQPEWEATPSQGDIAIVGMSCLFAGAPDLDTYWKNILSKVDAVSDPPADEWDPKVFYDPASKSNDRVYCKRGGYIGDLAQFRPLDFGVMPITVDGGEPDQWLALRVAHEALADAGYSDSPKEHVATEVILGKGTYVNRGNLTVGYHGMIVEHFLQVLKNLHPEYTDSDIQEVKQELKASLPPFSADTAPALIGNIIAGRISNRLDLMGPSFTVDAACASALVAIEIGVRNLLSGKCDLVLAGGANANAPLPTMSLFCQLGALSRREQIRPFDKNADGTILGEGLGMIVMKRREDAERDGNRIYALIKGVGIASDGRALHVMAPRVEGEELALRRAYKMAGFSPRTVGLIEAHGTATPVGDVTEVQALSRVFGERQGPLPSCAIGSVKSMIGHTMPAAGIAGVIKTALALYHKVLPPTLNCDEPNPALHLEKTPFYVNTETRPWIHGADTPRRAGVNSFGFGGINGHVVLEEYPEEKPQERNHLLHWETELFILEAASRQELIEQTNRFSEYLTRSGEPALKDLAYSLNTRLEGKSFRLSVIAASKEDLSEKLAHARGRLADQRCRQIKDNRGIYFFEEPLEGKLAFLFPGEGAQYTNMLLDLCLHFPEVRSCFDLADRALIHGTRQCLPSDFIFPRSILSEAERANVEDFLWQIDGAVEGVLVANWAMWTLLGKLEIRPDVIVGHSTGDYSAMFASNIIELNDEAKYIETILDWNKAHARLAQQMPVPEAALVAVAADSATVMSVADAVDGELYLAMDNCPHQSVLVGGKAAVEQAIEQLRSRGLIYEMLPFDRPYHTPMFQAYAEGAGKEFFAHLPVSAPKTETYSCTTAARYPNDEEGIRELFVAHWVKPVLFSQTVETMYNDGVRIFVEAGPRGNLTSFVSDILRGKQHLAMPANVARRSGLTQINHLAGVLAAQGIGMQLDYLYARRDPHMIAWDKAMPPAKPLSPAMKVSLAMPPLKVTPRERKTVVAEQKEVIPPARPKIEEKISAAPPTLPVLTPPASVPIPAAAVPSPSARAMQEYMKGMESFLQTEQQVMEGFLQRLRAAGTIAGPAAPAASAVSSGKFPLLGAITSLTAGQELTAVRQLSLEEDPFLREHALGGPVSTTDTALRPLVVLPLTMSMEVLAEAAAALMPNQVLIGMRDIQAHHWIRVDDAPVTLHITARRLNASSQEVEVQVQDVAGANGQKAAKAIPAIRGVMIFGSHYPQAPRGSAFSLTGEQTSRLASANLYDGRLMFHGPCFQGVAKVERSGGDGVIGQLQTLPTSQMFRSLSHPQFVTDPVVLDAAGQLVGFWAAEYLQRGFVVFPYRLETLRIYGPNRPAGERLMCRVKLQLLGNERMRSDLEILGGDGNVWMLLQGWEDRRFDPPERFHRAWTTPQEALISEPWKAPLADVPEKNGLECYRLENLFEPGNGLWKDLWASLVLSRQERKAFRTHGGAENLQMEWLGDRTAAKDAIRTYLKRHHRLELLPADIEIAQDAQGSLIPQGLWTQRLATIPGLSLSRSNGMAVALAGDGTGNRSFGIDVQALRYFGAEQQTASLTADERHLLSTVPATQQIEWMLRLQCAKRAAVKALHGSSEGIRIISFNSQTGVVRTALEKQAVGASPSELVCYTAREGDYVVATTIFEKRGTS